MLFVNWRLHYFRIPGSTCVLVWLNSTSVHSRSTRTHSQSPQNMRLHLMGFSVPGDNGQCPCVCFGSAFIDIFWPACTWCQYVYANMGTCYYYCVYVCACVSVVLIRIAESSRSENFETVAQAFDGSRDALAAWNLLQRVCIYILYSTCIIYTLVYICCVYMIRTCRGYSPDLIGRECMGDTQCFLNYRRFPPPGATTHLCSLSLSLSALSLFLSLSLSLSHSDAGDVLGQQQVPQASSSAVWCV